MVAARRSALGAAVGVTLALASASVWASRLRVQARTRVESQVEQREGTIVAQGRVLDAAGRAVPGVAVQGEWVAPAAGPDATVLTRTEADGTFRFSWPRLQAGDQPEVTIAVRVLGDANYAPAAQSLRAQLDRAAVQLRLEPATTKPATNEPTLAVAVAAAVGGIPLAGHALQLDVDGRHVATVRTDETGQGDVTIATSALGAPGVRRLRLAIEAGPLTNAAEQVVALELGRATEVRLVRSDAADIPRELAALMPRCGDDEVCLAGDVRAASGPQVWQGVATAEVVLHGGGVRLGSVTTSGDGRFGLRLRQQGLQQLLPPGTVGVVAEARTAAPWTLDAWSPVVSVEIAAPTPWLERMSLALLAFAALGLGGRMLLERWRQRRAIEALAADAAGVASEHLVAGHGTAGCDVRGLVMHGESGEASPATIVATGPAGQQRATQSAAQGFALPGLAPGLWQIRVELPEHAPLTLRLTIPHDGGLDGCVLRPHSLRALVRLRYAQALAAAGVQAIDWARTTMRQAEPRWLAAQRRGHSSIRVATEAAEAAAWGRRVDVASVEEARTRIAEAEGAGR